MLFSKSLFGSPLTGPDTGGSGFSRLVPRALAAALGVPLLAIALLGGGACAPTGGTAELGSPPSRTVTTQRLTLIGALDASGSARGSLLGPAAASTARLVAQLDPDKDRVMLYRLDRAATRFCGPEVPPSMQKLQMLLVAQMRQAAQHPGTHPASWWEKAATQAENAPGPIAIFLFTDGDSDNPTPISMARIAAAVRRLAANRRVVAVCLYGVKPSNFDVLDRQFASLGDRFRLYPPQNMDISWLSHRIQEPYAQWSQRQ